LIKGKCQQSITQPADGETGLLHFFHQVTPEEHHKQNSLEFERIKERSNELKKATQLEAMWQQCQHQELNTI